VGATPLRERHTPAYAARVRDALQEAIRHRERANRALPALLDTALRHRVWERLLDAYGAPFSSWRAFCLAPRPFGLGIDGRMVQALLDEATNPRLRARELARGAKPLLPHGVKRRQATEATTARVAPGTSAAYLVAKLKRDAPEYVNRLAAGEFPSAHAAAVAAGIATPTFTLRLEPVCIARQLIKRLSPADVRRVVELVTNQEWLTGPDGNAQRRARRSPEAVGARRGAPKESPKEPPKQTAA
jgi:hypothetical protein